MGTPHGATILDRIIKNEEANQPPPPRQIMDETAQKPKCTILPSSFVVWRGGGINVLSISYKHRRQPGKILNIKYLRLHYEIPAPGSSVPRTLVKAKTR